MLKFIKWFLGLFVPYVGSFEWKVARFFKGIKSTDSISSVNRQLLILMQKNLVIVNLWMEKEYKGYVGLSKKVRRLMYANSELIKLKFLEYSNANPVSDSVVKATVLSVTNEFFDQDMDKYKHLYQIMQFLKPGKYYNYIPTASFGRLLRDPNKEILEGDCNQIVTMYIFLYSLKFSISELNIKLLPEHVCLHFRNIDVEATVGMYHKYTEHREVLPVTEIVSTNLLDLDDFRENVRVISPRVMVKSAQLAYAISSLRDIVAKNLKVSYTNMAVHSMDVNNFSSAKFFASEAGDAELLHTIQHNEGVYLYKSKNFDAALNVFRYLGDTNMEKACYSGMYNKLVSTISSVKTLEQAKKYKSTYRKLLDLSRKMGDSALESQFSKILNDM